VTQFKDSRVVAAFNGNRLQYQYMIGNEQRLTGLESQVSALSGIGSSSSILSAISALQSSVIYRNVDSKVLNSAQVSVTGSSFSDLSGFSVTLNILFSKMIVFFTATDFWLSSGGSAANADLAFQLDSDPELIVCRAYSDNSPNQNTYGVGASYFFDNISPGNHTVKVRWRISSGATAYLGAGVSQSTIQLFAIGY
jgi:opacity protein-like surface antigen